MRKFRLFWMLVLFLIALQVASAFISQPGLSFTSTGTDTSIYGVNITTPINIILTNFTKSNSCTATRCLVYNSTQQVIYNTTFTGNLCLLGTYGVNISANKTHWLMTSADGASYTIQYTNTRTDLATAGNITWEWRWYNPPSWTHDTANGVININYSEYILPTSTSSISINLTAPANNTVLNNTQSVLYSYVKNSTGYDILYCNLTRFNTTTSVNVNSSITGNNSIINYTENNIPFALWNWNVSCNGTTSNTFTYNLRSMSISSVVAVPSLTSASLTFNTGIEANYSVAYGTTLSLGTTISNSTNELSHTITIPNLSNGTLYFFNISAMDIFNNQSVYSGNFTTSNPNPNCTSADWLSELTIATGVSSGVENGTVRVVLNASNINFNQLNRDGSDILICKSDRSGFSDFYLENLNFTTNQMRLYVENSNASFILRYGNPNHQITNSSINATFPFFNEAWDSYDTNKWVASWTGSACTQNTIGVSGGILRIHPYTQQAGDGSCIGWVKTKSELNLSNKIIYNSLWGGQVPAYATNNYFSLFNKTNTQINLWSDSEFQILSFSYLDAITISLLNTANIFLNNSYQNTKTISNDLFNLSYSSSGYDDAGSNYGNNFYIDSIYISPWQNFSVSSGNYTYFNHTIVSSYPSSIDSWSFTGLNSSYVINTSNGGISSGTGNTNMTNLNTNASLRITVERGNTIWLDKITVLENGSGLRQAKSQLLILNTTWSNPNLYPLKVYDSSLNLVCGNPLVAEKLNISECIVELYNNKSAFMPLDAFAVNQSRVYYVAYGRSNLYDDMKSNKLNKWFTNGSGLGGGNAYGMIWNQNIPSIGFNYLVGGLPQCTPFISYLSSADNLNNRTAYFNISYYSAAGLPTYYANLYIDIINSTNPNSAGANLLYDNYGGNGGVRDYIFKIFDNGTHIVMNSSSYQAAVLKFNTSYLRFNSNFYEGTDDFCHTNGGSIKWFNLYSFTFVNDSYQVNTSTLSLTNAEFIGFETSGNLAKNYSLNPSFGGWNYSGRFHRNQSASLNLVSGLNTISYSQADSQGATFILFSPLSSAIINSYSPVPTPKFAQSSFITADITKSGGFVLWANFTLKRPDGTYCFNNLVGTNVSSTWNSSACLINQTGTYSYDINASDNSSITTKSDSFSITDVVSIQPVNTTQTLEANQPFIININISTNTPINLTFNVSENSNHSCFQNVFSTPYLLANATGSSLNYTIQSLPNTNCEGMWNWSINVTRQEYPYSILIPINITINTKHANISFNNASLTWQATLNADINETSLSNETTNSTNSTIFTGMYYINNTGDYNATNFTAHFLSNSGYDAYLSVIQNFTVLRNGTSNFIAVKFSPTGSANINDHIYFTATTGIYNITVQTSNQPNVLFTVTGTTTLVVVQQGGGGGGGVEPCADDQYCIDKYGGAYYCDLSNSTGTCLTNQTLVIAMASNNGLCEPTIGENPITAPKDCPLHWSDFTCSNPQSSCLWKQQPVIITGILFLVATIALFTFSNDKKKKKRKKEGK